MTRLLIDPNVDIPDEGTGPITLTATLLDPDPVAVQTFTVTDAATVVTLPAPAASEAWRLTIRRPRTAVNRLGLTTTDPGPIVVERTVHFGTTPTAWAALADIDPATLATDPPGGTAWDATVAELRAEIAALQAALATGGGTSIDLAFLTEAGDYLATEAGDLLLTA